MGSDEVAPGGAGDYALRRKAERMGAVAGLAKTVQHDLNNLLTVVFANLEMLKRTAAEGAPQRQLDRIQEASRRFEATTRCILSLVRRPAGEMVTIRLSEALGALQPLLLMILPGSGALVLDLAADDCQVRIERSALEEALLALAQQVADGPPRGGTLALATVNQVEAAALAIRVPHGQALPALALLAEIARTAGGTAEVAAGTLHLLLPRHAPAVVPA